MADVESLKKQLAALGEAPSELITPTLFYEDTNAPSLAVELARGWPSASLWSDEAGLVVGANGMSDDVAMGYIALLNRLWDGRSFDRTRLVAPSAFIRGRRLTCSLMMQPLVLTRLLSVAGGASRAMGLIARFLVAWPGSTIGTRLYRHPAHETPHMGRLWHRMRQLLDTPLPITDQKTMILSPPALALSPGARKEWISLHDRVEAELGRDGQLKDVVDIGAKIAENAARIAANCHIIEHGPDGNIHPTTMEAAADLVTWHLFEARRIIIATGVPQTVGDAVVLLEWLQRDAQQQRERGRVEPCDLRRIQQFGPAPTRERRRRDAALALLVETSNVIEIRREKVPRFFPNPRLHS
jgi:hypothetical protein